MKVLVCVKNNAQAVTISDTAKNILKGDHYYDIKDIEIFSTEIEEAIDRGKIKVYIIPDKDSVDEPWWIINGFIEALKTTLLLDNSQVIYTHRVIPS